MYSQTARKGVITCASTSPSAVRVLDLEPSTRISASPLNNRIRLMANSAYPTGRAFVRPVPCVFDVEDAEENDRQQNQQPQHEMAEKHELVKVILIRLTPKPFQKRDTGKIGGVGAKQREQDEYTE